MSLYEAWAAQPTERKIANAKHVNDLDRACASLAASNAYACEAGLAFDEGLKECNEGQHSAANVAYRVAGEIYRIMRGLPGSDHRKAAKLIGITDERVLSELDWCFM